jgi:PKD repeat protein
MKLTTRLRTVLQFAFLFCTVALFAAPATRAAQPAIYAFNQSGSGTINLGESVSLNWSVSHGASVSISPGIGPVTGTEITVSPTQTTTYTLTASNASGSVSKTKKITVIVPPTVHTLTATPDTVLPGKAVTLKWTGTGATYYTVTTDAGANLGNVFGTTLKVYPQATTTYTVTAVNSAGTGARAILVTVVPPGPKPAIASFSATPSTVTAGGSTTLAWSVSGADSVSISPGVGAVSGTSTAVSPTATTTYTLTAKNINGSVTKKTTVAVNVAPPTIASFTATPDTILAGQSSTLAWSVTGADSLSISPDVGAVTGASVIVSPDASTTYTLSATNAGGTVTKTVALAVTPPTPPPVISSFTASASSITPGQSLTLSWSATGADSLSLSPGIGAVSGSSITVTPGVDTTYVLTAANNGGAVTASVSVTVSAPVPPPVVQSFTATPAAIVAGQSTTLAWSVVGATAISIAADAGSSPGAVSGNSLSVSPVVSTVYTLTAGNESGTVTQSVSVAVTEPAPLSVQINPSAGQINTGATQAFIASVTGTPNQLVTWSVVEAGGGSITSAGLYTAPATPGTYHVQAVAAADPAVSAQATITVTSPVATPPSNPSSDGTHFVHLMSPNAGQRFLAPGFLRVFVAAKDLNNWPNRHRAASVQIMVDDVVHATIPGDQSEYWVYKTSLSGIPAGPRRVWARAHFVDGKVFDSEVVSIVVEQPPAYAQVIELTSDVVLTGNLDYERIGAPNARIRINGNGFTIRSDASWTGRLTLKHVDVTNLGGLLDPTPGVKVATTSAVQIENCIFDATNSLEVAANGSAAAIIRANEFRSNMFMNVAQFPINLTTGADATDPVIRLRGSSTAQQLFQGNNVGLSTIEVNNARNWLIGGATAAEGNVLIGPRVGVVLVGGIGHQIRGNISDQLYYGGWSQGNNFELNSASDLVVEHNLISGGSWPVRGTGGAFRYNLVLNAGEDWLWISQSNAQVHHNIFAEGENDRAGIFLLYAPQNVQFTNNTLDGFGLHQNQVPLLAEDGTSANVASNVFYRFRGTPIVGLRGTAAVTANHNSFYNPGVAAIRNYQDNRAPAQDIGGLNAQVDPQFATAAPPSYSTVNRGDVWNRTLTLGQLLAAYRAYYTPASGSPLIDAGDPAGGAGNDIGAIGAGAPNSADQFGFLDGGTPPTVSVSIQPATKALTAGGTATFSATVFGAANQSVAWSVVQPGGGSITSAGVYTAPATPGTYHVKATAAADASAWAQATVIVSAAGPVAPTIASFTANPGTVQPGGSTTLAWSVSGADSLSISPGIGAVTGNSLSVAPAATTTYTLSATNTAGTVTKTVTVAVSSANGPSIDTFTASSTQVQPGEAVTLSWTTTQMGSLWLSADAGGDPGSVAPNSSLVVHPQTTTRYAISGWNGQTNAMISKALVVNVGPPPAPVISSFSANPATIPIGGSTTLMWAVSNVDAVSIAADVGPSPGAVTGNSLGVSPTETTTYTITAALGAQSVTRTVTVTVTGPTPPVIGAFYAQPAFVQSGASTTLHWSVSGAEQVSISGGPGLVNGNSVSVTPTQTTTYTLSASNAIGTTTRTAVVTVYTPNPNGGVTHPRVWLTPALVATLRQRAAQNDPAWVRLRNACDAYVGLPVAFPDETGTSGKISGGYQYYDYMKPTFQLALGYQVALTVDPTRAGQYAAKAREILLALSDPVRHGDPLIDSGWAIRAYVPALAVGYDWIFETLSDSDRAQVFTEINRWITAYETGGFGRSFPQGNYFAGYYAAKALGALATEGENPQAGAMWTDWLNRVHYGMVQPYHQQWLRGGGAPDGWNYGPLETLNMLSPLAAAFTAKGLDLIHDSAHPHGYPDGTAKWVTQFTWPDMKSVSDRGLVYSGNNPTPTDASWATHYAGLLRLANGDNAPLAQRYALDLRAEQGVNQIDPWVELLFHNPSAPTSNYRTDLSYRTPGDGQVAMRSSWDANAVWAAFQCGPYTGYVHSAEEFYDKGGLAIQRGGVQFLVNAWGAMFRHTPGTADGSGSDLYHSLYYELYGTSADGVASGRRIFNTFYAVRPGGYWGQAGVGPGQTATTLSRFEEGIDYVLMRGANIEGMYFEDHPIQSWTRTVVYVRPQLFFVYDRTSVSSASVDHWMAWHVVAAPAEQAGAAPGTRRIDVVDTRPAFGGNLFRGRISTVLPAGNVVTSVNLFNKDKIYRVEVRPGTPAATNTWLTVLDAAASTAQAGAASPLTSAAGTLSTAAAEGALVRNAGGNYAVLFSKSGSPIADPFTLRVPADDTYLLVADLLPNAGYTVTAVRENDVFVVQVTSGGGVPTTAEGTLKVDISAAGIVTPL